jgi:hypothetical protein
MAERPLPAGNPSKKAVDRTHIWDAMDDHSADRLLRPSHCFVIRLVESLRVVDIGYDDVDLMAEPDQALGQTLGITLGTTDGRPVGVSREDNLHHGSPIVK